MLHKHRSSKFLKYNLSTFVLVHFHESSRDILEYIVLICTVTLTFLEVFWFLKNKEKKEHIIENPPKTFRSLNNKFLSRGTFSWVEKKDHRNFNETIL